MGGSAPSSHAPAVIDRGPLPLRMIGWISLVCGWAAAGMIAAAILITCQMIFVRYVLNWSTIWQTEAVVYLMVGATLVGLPYVQRVRGHVNVDLAPRMLGRRARFALAVLVQLCGLVVMGLIAVHGYEIWYEAWDWGERSDTVWGIKLWIPYLAMPIGFGLFMLQLIGDFFLLLLGYESPFGLDELAEVEAAARAENVTGPAEGAR